MQLVAVIFWAVCALLLFAAACDWTREAMRATLRKQNVKAATFASFSLFCATLAGVALAVVAGI